MNIDIEKLRGLADSATVRASQLHTLHDKFKADGQTKSAASTLNDFFYWSGKATAYRGIIAMIELQAIVDEETDKEGSCP